MAVWREVFCVSMLGPDCCGDAVAWGHSVVGSRGIAFYIAHRSRH